MKTAEQIVAKNTNVIVTTIMAMVGRFLELKSTTFIQIWQKTPNISRMRKTGNRFAGKIYKLNCLNCVTNYDYENMVNKARSKEAMTELKMAMISAGVPIDKIDSFFDTAKSDITDKAESFRSKGLPFGEYVGKSKCIIINTPKSKEDGGKSEWAGIEGHYIQVRPLNYAIPVYKWFGSDEVLTEAEVAELQTFITPKKENTNQGLKKEIPIAAPRFETILSISMNKAHYQLTKDD